MIVKPNNKKIPKKINPCPIIEAVIELRFNSDFPPNAIFGVIYNEFKSAYPSLQELPILQLPEDIRNNDAVLKFKPQYKLTSKDENFLFMVGTKAISLANLSPYAGWPLFSKKINDLIDKIKKLKLITNYTRISIRYINGFECNIFKKINLSLVMEDENLSDDLDKSIRLEFPKNKFTCALQLANNTKIKTSDRIIKGSIIDIDTYTENPNKGKINTIIERGHLEGEKFFFSLLKKEFINKELNPEY